MLGTTMSLKAAALSEGGGQHYAERVYRDDGQRIDQISAFDSFFHTFSPTFFPSIPAGFISSTTISMRNTKASVRLEFI